jgi:hypothetical protein
MKEVLYIYTKGRQAKRIARIFPDRLAFQAVVPDVRGSIGNSGFQHGGARWIRAGAHHATATGRPKRVNLPKRAPVVATSHVRLLTGPSDAWIGRSVGCDTMAN